MPRHLTNEASPEVALPITPMLDMTFQLLAFFIMTYRPNELTEGAVEFSLPAAGSAKAKDNEPDPTVISEKDSAVPAHISIEIQSGQDRSKGSVAGITVQEATSGGAFACGTVEALNKYLKQKHDEINPTKKDGKDESTDIKIIASAKLKHSEVMKVVDACLNYEEPTTKKRLPLFTKISFEAPKKDG